MNRVAVAIQIAGIVHWVLAAANLFLPGTLQYRENLARVPAIIRQIFVVHSVYIVMVLLLFGGLCLGFAPELAGGSALGRYLPACLAGFWLLRLPLQWFYFDREVRRRHRLGDVTYTAAAVFLAGLFMLAVWVR